MIKIVLRYDSAFWLGSDYGWLGQTDNPSGLSVMDCSDPKGGRDALAVFCGGTAARAMAGLSEDQVLAKVMDIIEPMLGPKVRTPATVVQTNWTDHPWVGGGYDTWAKPWKTEDPWEPMRRAHDGLHFTCAELAPEFPGFIEGATRAAQEVAARVLQQI
jgi:monoamine oxidase